jgi:hypothetical protein
VGMQGIRCLSVILILILMGCEFKHETQPSVLVIAVEGLSFESLSCDADETSERTQEGIRPFCEEAVRFSHAFAPSTMSQATMASLMTGLYPIDHGVHHNGGEFLSAHFRTLAEVALSKGYHTLFVSGGAPIWRKSGLAQGFEVFDDSVDIAPGTYYRSARDVIKTARSWIEHDSPSSPFLTVLFLSDLQFPQMTTYTREGEVREKSADAQIEEVAESVGSLVAWLKSRRQWHSTHVVLVGLNSVRHRENDNEPAPLSLKSSSVQVTLFIKPARKEKDNQIQWAVDRSVSLVDVGKTMFQWLGSEPSPGSIAAIEPESLAEAVTQSEPVWKDSRLILSETAWPDWLEGSGTRVAVRQNQFLYIPDRHPLIFNTLTDHMEVVPLRLNDPLWNSVNGEVMTLMKKINTTPWQGMNGHWQEQIEVARELWRGNQLSRRPHGMESWEKWYLQRALNMHDWREVKRLAQENGEPVGTFVAARNLGEPVPIPHNPCVHLVLGTRGDRYSMQTECEDERILALHNWQSAKGEEERMAAQERFLRLYAMQRMDQEIGRLNFLNELRWDVDRGLPEAPQLLDYLLTLKELEPYNKKISSLFVNKDMTF